MKGYHLTSCLIAWAASAHTAYGQVMPVGDAGKSNSAITIELPELPADAHATKAYVPPSSVPKPNADEELRRPASVAGKPKSLNLSEVKNINVPIELTKDTSATINANKLELKHQSEDLYGNLSIGSAAYGEGGYRPTAAWNMAYALSEASALGGNLYFSPQRLEAVLNGVYQWSSGVRAKGSIGHMWGKQDFDFPSGKTAVKLGQSAYAFDLKYHGSEWFKNLQAVGVSVWGSRAAQYSADTPIYFLRQTEKSYSVFLDSRKLALGRLHGQAVDMQFALLPNMVVQTALGREQLIFPFSDGSRENIIKPFVDLKLHYEPLADWLLTGQYQNGTSGRQFGLSMGHSEWKLAVMRQVGSNGVKGSSSVMLSYDFVLGKKSRNAPTLAERMQVNAKSDKYAALREAATRPSKMPQSFLAKIDPTATKNIISICKNASTNNVVIQQNGQLKLTVGSGAITILDVVRNGEDFAYSEIFSGGDASLNLFLPKLPQALATDIYSIEVIDSNGIRHRIDADVSLIKSLSCQ